MARDHYRKALTSHGPHTADYMVTRLVRMAGALKRGEPFVPDDPLLPVAARRRGPPGGHLAGPGSRRGRRLRRLADGAGRRRRPRRAARGARPGAPAVLRRDLHLARRLERRGQPGRGRRAARGRRLGALRRPERRGADDPGHARGRAGGRRHPHRPPGVALDGVLRGLRRLPRHAGPGARRALPVRGRRRHPRGRPLDPLPPAVAPFDVVPWDGIVARDLQVGPAATSPSWWTRSPTRGPTSRRSAWCDDDGRSPICRTCSFRPWATTGEVASAEVDGARPQRQGPAHRRRVPGRGALGGPHQAQAQRDRGALPGRGARHLGRDQRRRPRRGLGRRRRRRSPPSPARRRRRRAAPAPGARATPPWRPSRARDGRCTGRRRRPPRWRWPWLGAARAVGAYRRS
jgi:hypothetical protein